MLLCMKIVVLHPQEHSFLCTIYNLVTCVLFLICSLHLYLVPTLSSALLFIVFSFVVLVFIDRIINFLEIDVIIPVGLLGVSTIYWIYYQISAIERGFGLLYLKKYPYIEDVPNYVVCVLTKEKETKFPIVGK